MVRRKKCGHLTTLTPTPYGMMQFQPNINKYQESHWVTIQVPVSKFQSQTRLGKSASCCSFPFLAPPLDTTGWLQSSSSSNHSTTFSQVQATFVVLGTSKVWTSIYNGPFSWKSRGQHAAINLWGGGEMPKYWRHFVDQTDARLKFILDPTSINLSKHVNRSDPVARRGGENNTIYKGYYVDSAAGQRRHSVGTITGPGNVCMGT